jgi:hypothetical protein
MGPEDQGPPGIVIFLVIAAIIFGSIAVYYWPDDGGF